MMTKKSVPQKLSSVSVTVRMDLEVHERIHEVADLLSVKNDSLMYRWICEAFLEVIDNPEDPPTMPVIVSMARQYIRGKEKKFKRQ
tara:strand:+ start:750 stop:1007 length:258 start_codon:yes stop_codon:yes gene_type:complete